MIKTIINVAFNNRSVLCNRGYITVNIIGVFVGILTVIKGFDKYGVLSVITLKISISRGAFYCRYYAACAAVKIVVGIVDYVSPVANGIGKGINLTEISVNYRGLNIFVKYRKGKTVNSVKGIVT